jgi:hypothetical protein
MRPPRASTIIAARGISTFYFLNQPLIEPTSGQAIPFGQSTRMQTQSASRSNGIRQNSSAAGSGVLSGSKSIYIGIYMHFTKQNQF